MQAFRDRLLSFNMRPLRSAHAACIQFVPFHSCIRRCSSSPLFGCSTVCIHSPVEGHIVSSFLAFINRAVINVVVYRFWCERRLHFLHRMSAQEWGHMLSGCLAWWGSCWAVSKAAVLPDIPTGSVRETLWFYILVSTWYCQVFKKPFR